MAEFTIGKGRFNEVPFLLFLMVDFATAYLFSLVLHEKRRPLVAILFVVVASLLFATPTLRDEYQRYLYKQKTEAAIAEEEARTRAIIEEERLRKSRR